MKCLLIYIISKESLFSAVFSTHQVKTKIKFGSEPKSYSQISNLIREYYGTALGFPEKFYNFIIDFVKFIYKQKMNQPLILL